MTIPSWVDAEKLALISAATLMFIQYVKASIPEKLIPVASLLIAFGIAMLLEFAEINVYAQLIFYALLATAGADFSYQFLSSSSSKPFTLPSKTQLTTKEKPNEKKND